MAMIRRWLALTYCLYALRLAALSHFYFNPLYYKRSLYADVCKAWVWVKKCRQYAVRQPENGIGLSTLPTRIPRGKPMQRHYGSNQPYRDLCKIPIFGTFLRNALLERLKIFQYSLRVLRCCCFELCSNPGFCKGLIQ